MKNITFRADHKDIEAARTRAREEGTTLTKQFRLWLAATLTDERQPAENTVSEDGS